MSCYYSNNIHYFLLEHHLCEHFFHKYVICNRLRVIFRDGKISYSLWVTFGNAVMHYHNMYNYVCILLCEFSN